MMASLRPLIYFSLSMLFGLVALKGRRPGRQPLLLALVMTFGLLAFGGITDICPSLDQANVLGLFILIYLSHMACVLCVETHVRIRSSETSGDWKDAYKMLFNGRWLGTNRQAPDIHVRSRARMHRHIFLLHRLSSVLGIYGLNWLHAQLLLRPHLLYFQPLQASDFLPFKQTYFRRLPTVTTRETLVRLWIVFYFVWSAWALFTGLHDVLALIFVGMGLDDPKDWPPLYGSPGQMYSVRRFWGKFWHRLVYRTYTAFGAVLCEKVLRLSSRSFFGRIVVHFLVFFLSGVVHALVTLQLGFTCGYWEDIAWFALNFAALLTEEGVQWLFSMLLTGPNGHRALGKAVGFLWVFTFLFWSLPKSQYPKMHCLPVAS